MGTEHQLLIPRLVKLRLTEGSSALDFSKGDRGEGLPLKLLIGGQSELKFNSRATYRGGGVQGLRHWKAELKETAKFSDNRCPVHLTKAKCNCLTSNIPLPTLT